MRKQRCIQEIYNDLNELIVNVFRVMRDPEKADELCRLLTLTPYAREELKCAQTIDDDDSDVERARKIIARTFFNIGVDLTPKGATGGFHTQIKYKARTCNNCLAWAKYPSYIKIFRDRLAGVILENRDALWVMKHYDAPDALHYLDPPYVPGEWVVRKGCYIANYSMEEHQTLLETALSLKGMVIISGYDSDLYNDMLKGWSKDTTKNKNLFGADRTECLWISPNCDNGQCKLLE